MELVVNFLLALEGSTGDEEGAHRSVDDGGYCYLSSKTHYLLLP